MADTQVQMLAGLFSQTISSTSPADLKNAEDQLVKSSSNPSHCIAILKLVAAEQLPVAVRQAASVSFKNHVKTHWVGRLADDIGLPAIPTTPQPEKEQIKALITPLMLSAPPPVRAQLSEALTIISSHDFPERWQGLLPELCQRLASEDPSVVNGVLDTANSIFKRYRNQIMTSALSEELKFCQMAVKPLLQALQRTTAALPAAAADAAANPAPLRLLLSSARLACRVFYSLNSPGLTEEFDNTLDAWMAEFHTLLTFDDPLPPHSDPERETEGDAAKAAVVANTSLFMEVNEEEFAKFLQTFVQDVWTLLTKVSMAVRQDGLAMGCIRFLTTVSKSVHFALFGNEDVLKQVCDNIVIPNTRLREDAEEMFDFNWVEYVRRDSEASDADTRRRAATELVRSLTSKFPREVTQLFSSHVGAMLKAAAAAPTTEWKSKDCALFLVTALAARTKTAAGGATTTNDLVDIGDFYRSHVIPDIMAADVNELPVLKADALRFLTTFRSQIPKEEVVTAVPGIVRLLGSDSNVVHSYAAVCIERLLSLKDGGQPRFTVADLGGQLEALLQGLFGAFSKPESGENEYVMKCVMRLFIFVGPQIAPVAPMALTLLSKMLLLVCKNPTHPGFNHFLFESVAALIRFGTAADAALLDQMQQQLFPAFQVVLSEDVQEFHPYVFQIFAQMIELRSGPGVQPALMQIFPPLLSPVFWERPGNVPPLVRLIQAYLDKAPADVASGGHLVGVLGVFQKLLASKALDHEAFAILGALMSRLPPAAFDAHLPTIWQLLFQRLQAARTTKYVKGLVGFLARFMCSRGPQPVVDSLDQLQPNPPLSTMILESVWAPALPTLGASAERRLAIAASSRLLTEVARLQQADGGRVWGKLLAAAVEAAAGAAGVVGDDGGDDDVDQFDEFTGYSAAFAQLHNAAKPDLDPLPTVQDAPKFLAQQLAAAAAAQPGKFPQLIAATVPAEAQAQLQALLRSAGATLA